MKQAAQAPLVAGIGHLHQQFHPPVKVAVHHVRAADPDLAVLVLPPAERVDPGVLEEPAEDTADPDVLG